MKIAFSRQWPAISASLLDAGVLLGAASFVFGLYLVWRPLAPLVGGLLLAAGCAFSGYDRFRKERGR